MTLTSEIKGNKDISISEIKEIIKANVINSETCYIRFYLKLVYMEFWEYETSEQRDKEFESIQKQLKTYMIENK